MHRVDLGAQTPHHLFPQNFRTVTDTPADWCNAVQEEICSVIESTGQALTDQTTQLNQTITAMLCPNLPSYFVALDPSTQGGWYGQRLQIPGVTPIPLAGLGAIEFYITFVFKPDHSNEYNYTTLKQSFLKISDRWVNTASPGETVDIPNTCEVGFKAHVPMVKRTRREAVVTLQNGDLILNNMALRLLTQAWNETTSPVFKVDSPQYSIKGFILSHFKRYLA